MSLLYPAGESIRAEYSFSARPRLQETCWAIEQCLRCPGVSATWAWVDERIPARVHRRWQLAAEVGGGVGLFFRPDAARARTRLGRLTIAGHAAGGRRGGNQTGAYRSAVSPGRPGRRRPGVGDRPCRGCCASGSRSGRSSELRSARPELRPVGARAVRRPESATFDHRLQLRKPNGWACASVNRWPRPRRCCRKRSFFPLMSPRTGVPSVNWRSIVSASRPWSVWKRAICPESLLCDVTGCTHLWDGEERFLQAVRGYWRERGYHIQLALAGTVGAAWALAHTETRRWCPQGMKRRLCRAFPWRRCGCPCRPWSGWKPWACARLATCFDFRARRWPAGLA